MQTTLVVAMLQLSGVIGVGMAQTAGSRIDAALQNITMLIRSGRVGYATFWDGNKYVQCRRMQDRTLRCEAAGASMQPSLKQVLSPERLSRLAELGWVLDPSFGNYVQNFPAETASSQLANDILRVLTEVYSAEASDLETQTAWVADMPCPPRNGPSQNLAGSVNDAPAMQRTAIRTCTYAVDPTLQAPRTAASSEGLFALYGANATSEIQRLRVNIGRRVHVAFSAGIGYVQCMPNSSPPAIYCEAQSAESWPALAAILTPDRVKRLRDIGYAAPGRAPNYWKSYPLNAFSDAAIAGELLTILHDAYGYTGAMTLKITTE